MPEDSDILNNALITVFANSGISLMAGIAVFGTLGHMAHVQGVAISEVATAGVGLLFVTKAGLYWLDIVDHFVNTYGLVAGY